MKKSIFNLGTAIILILVTAFVTADAQALADLSVQYVDVSNVTYVPGDPILVVNRIKNVGTTSSDSYFVDFYASTNSTITSSDHYIGWVGRSGLAAGAEHYYFTSGSLPTNIPLGSYYIGIIVSCSNDFWPSNDTGYDSSTITVGSFSSGNADIAIQSVNAVNGTYHAGDEIVIGSLLENEGSDSSDSFTVDFYASEDRKISTEDYHMGSSDWSGFSVGESFASDTTARFPDNIPTGDYYIGMRIYCSNDSNTGNNKRYDYQKISVIGEGGGVRENRIHGRVTYSDRNNVRHPVRYALVNIVDKTLPSLVNEQTYTGPNGEYNVPVTGNISGRSVEVTVSTEGVYREGSTTSNICKVQDTISMQTYHQEKTANLSSQAIDLHIPENTSGSNRGAFNVFDSVVEGFLKAKAFLGITPSAIDVRWPADNTAYRIQEIYIKFLQDDRWDRDVIMHEYGHFIHRSYDFAVGSAGSNASHTWNKNLRNWPEIGIRSKEQAMNLAFRESWATLFSIATQYGDTGYPYSGDAIYNDTLDTTIADKLESDTNLHSSPGELFESMNCCTLWDIFDNHNDFNDKFGDNTLTKIWTISQVNKPDTIQDFWNSWIQTYPNTSGDIRPIFKDHQMGFVP